MFSFKPSSVLTNPVAPSALPRPDDDATRRKAHMIDVPDRARFLLLHPNVRMGCTTFYPEDEAFHATTHKSHDAKNMAWEPCSHVDGDYSGKDFLEIDFGGLVYVTHVSTRSRFGAKEWVTSYALFYRDEGCWHAYGVLQGNTARDAERPHRVGKSGHSHITCTALRFVPVEWACPARVPAMRVGAYGERITSEPFTFGGSRWMPSDMDQNEALAAALNMSEHADDDLALALALSLSCVDKSIADPAGAEPGPTPGPTSEARSPEQATRPPAPALTVSEHGVPPSVVSWELVRTPQSAPAPVPPSLFDLLLAKSPALHAVEGTSVTDWGPAAAGSPSKPPPLRLVDAVSCSPAWPSEGPPHSLKTGPPIARASSSISDGHSQQPKLTPAEEHYLLPGQTDVGAPLAARGCRCPTGEEKEAIARLLDLSFAAGGASLHSDAAHSAETEIRNLSAPACGAPTPLSEAAMDSDTDADVDCEEGHSPRDHKVDSDGATDLAREPAGRSSPSSTGGDFEHVSSANSPMLAEDDWEML